VVKLFNAFGRFSVIVRTAPACVVNTKASKASDIVQLLQFSMGPA